MSTTDHLTTPTGLVITPVTAAEVADLLAPAWIDLLEAFAGDAEAVWALFAPRLTAAFAEVVTDWWELPIDGVTNAHRYPEAAARHRRQTAP